MPARVHPFRRSALFASGLLLILLTMPLVLTWRSWRQAKQVLALNRQLITAVKHNDAKTALWTLAQGADPNIQENIWNPSVWQIFRARLTGQPFLVQTGDPALLLVWRSPDTGQRVTRNRYAIVKALLEHGASVEEHNAEIAMIYAAAEEDNRCLEALLTHSHNANRILYSNVLWHVLIADADRDEKRSGVVTTLLDRGADPNFDPGRGTMLLYAVRAGDEDAAQQLIARGADVNRVCRLRATALKAARAQNSPALIRLLKAAGARE